MTRPDLSRLSHEEKDALILALLDRVAALEAKLGMPPKTPGSSSIPPSRGQKATKPPRPKKPRRKREGPGVTRDRASDPDHVVECFAAACPHCGTAVAADGQSLRHAYDHIDLPPIRPVLTRVPPPAARHTAGRAAAGLAVRTLDRHPAGLSAPSPRGRL